MVQAIAEAVSREPRPLPVSEGTNHHRVFEFLLKADLSGSAVFQD